MNHMTIKGQFYRQYVRQQRAAANRLKAQVKCYHDSLEIITDGYNSLLDGKWKHMMSLKQNYDGTSSYFMIPLKRNTHLLAFLSWGFRQKAKIWIKEE